jgi:hypothetical protein
VRRTPAIALALLAALAAAAACTSSDGRECRVGADCASGVCTADGTCVRNDGATSDAAAPPPPPAGDASADAPTDAGDAALPGCTPNHDGTITRDEVPIAPGLRATFRIAQDEDVSTAGTTSGGKRVWDLSGALPSDANVLVETLPITGTWYAGNFPGASYATKLTASSDLLGVFETASTALLLRGVASPADGVSKTELTNSPAVTVLGFPLKEGASWTSDVNVSGTAAGFPAAYGEKYESKIDASGTLKTPLGTFDVLRVNVLLTRDLTMTTRTFAFVTECYGTIATITSGSNEQTVEFTHAAEVRRIAP